MPCELLLHAALVESGCVPRARRRYGGKQISVPGSFPYMEVEVAANPWLPESLSMIIAYWSKMAGKAGTLGAHLRAWCLAQITSFELAFHREDLMGKGSTHMDKWGKDLKFGFSFLVNDGDESSEQQGWSGYYPHALVHGWNEGQKQPSKTGVVQFAGGDRPAAGECCAVPR